MCNECKYHIKTDLIHVSLDKDHQYHCLDSPAYTANTGIEIWFQHGLKHRIGGPAEIRFGVSEEWYNEGRLHREDGPAIILYKFEIAKYWVVDGKIHNSIGKSPDKSRWFWHGDEVTEDMIPWIKSREYDLYNLSDQEKIEIKMYMASLS